MVYAGYVGRLRATLFEHPRALSYGVEGTCQKLHDSYCFCRSQKLSLLDVKWRSLLQAEPSRLCEEVSG